MKPTSGFKNQRERSDFRVGQIRAERKLRRDADYKPQFRAYPVVETEIDVKISRKEIDEIREFTGQKRLSDEELVRAAFMLWYQQNRARPLWVRPDGLGCPCC